MSRISNLDGASRVYAVLGDPVSQVQTPQLINPLFEKFGKNTFAVPFHVTPQELQAAWRAFSAMSNIAGIGVTVPHKVAAARLCDQLTSAARAVGAVNSIQRTDDGRMIGALFDGIGFVRGLGRNRALLQGANVLLVGAGGAGRAIAHALAGEGISRLSVLDLDPASVAYTVELANTVAGRQVADAGDASLDGHSVLVNATPVGLKPGQPFPISLTALQPGMLVADIASLDRKTELLETAAAIGCRTSDGDDMLRAQIALIAGFATGESAGREIRRRDN